MVSSESTAAHAIDRWHEFRRLNKPPPSTSVHFGVPPRWSRPPPSRLKLKVDGAWCERSETGGASPILRDAEGNFVVAATSLFSNVFSPLQVEALAVRAGLAFTVESGYHI